MEELEDVDKPGRSNEDIGSNWPSSESVGEGAVLAGTNREGYGGDDIDEFDEVDEDAGEVSAVALAAAALFAALRLFLEASGSLMKIHSRPLEEHLEQGYWRLHLTFDSAHA